MEKASEVHITESMRVLFLLFLSMFVTVKQGQNLPVNVSVGLILDLNSEMAIKSAIQLAVADFYKQNINYTTRIDLHLKDSKDDVVAAAADALTLIQNDNVQAILGPSTSQQASFLAQLGQKTEIPIITFTATNPALTSVRSPYFFRATPNDSTQTGAISALMKAFRWREAAVIYDDNEFGMGILSFLADSLTTVDSRISSRSPIPPNASDDRIEKELLKIRGLQTKVIIVHMLPTKISGFNVFKVANRLGMMTEGYAWLLTDGVVNLLDSANHHVSEWLYGALGVKPYIATSEELDDFKRRWKKENPRDTLDVYSLYARDAVVALAIAIERMGSDLFRNQTSSRLVSSQIPRPVSANGARLIEELSKVQFKGFMGNFGFVDGQLPEAAYSIVNINNTKPPGFWTRKNGLSKQANTKSTSPENLLPIIWPGDVRFAPKGWGMPAIGKRTKIAIPLKKDYSEFVTIRDGKPMGFCIDLFEELIKLLPYSFEPKYVFFDGTYNDMLKKVFQKEFDGAVGDITILAERSNYVDFTLPYTDSWVFIVAKANRGKSNDKWLFLRPMKSDLWATLIGFFLFVGFVVWFLEHRVNESFRGPPSNQVGTSLLFSFSTMVFAHRERVISNLTRVVVVVWCFVTLVVIQSYTASLTSLLTVDVAKPLDYDVDKLIARGDFVGVNKNSFLTETLVMLGFDDKKIFKFDTYDECNDMLQKDNITAAFIEKPYLDSFLGKHCETYSAKQAFPTGGFGFAFQQESPLVMDMSRAILQVGTNLYNVTKNGTMSMIERKWFCPSDCEIPKLKETTLELKSFIGLFAIAGGVCLLGVVVSMVSFYLENRRMLSNSDPEETGGLRIRRWLSVYDSPATHRYPFRKTIRSSPTSSGSTSPC